MIIDPYRFGSGAVVKTPAQGAIAVAGLAPVATSPTVALRTPASGAIAIAGLAPTATTWTPASVFSGENGGFWDGQDAATIFQNTAGTTPSAIGNTVGYLGDKSGNGNHMNGNVGVGVTRQAAGIQFTGGTGFPDSNIGLSRVSFAMGSNPNTTGFTQIVSGTVASLASNRCFFSIQPSGSILSQGMYVGTSGAVNIIIGWSDGSFTSYVTNTGDVALSTPVVLTTSVSTTTGKLQMRVNGTLVKNVATTAGKSLKGGSLAMTFGESQLGTGNRGYYAYNGTINSALWIARVLTDDEIANVEAWMAARVGSSTLAVASPGAGAITTAGLAPTADTVRQPGVGAVTLTGRAPTVIRGTVAPPGSGAITVAGVAPTAS